MGKRIFIRVALLLVLTLLGGGAWAVWGDASRFQTQLQPATGDFTPSVYVAPETTPTDTNALLSPATIIEAGITRVTSPVQLAYLIEDHPQIAIIYVAPEAVALVDDGWLRQQYKAGRMIVAFKTPHSVLGKKLGVQPTVPDSRLELLSRPDPFYFSAYFGYSGVLQSESIAGEYAIDFAQDANEVPHMLEGTLGNIERAQQAPTVPEQILSGSETPLEKVQTLFTWVWRGCLWQEC